MNKLVLALIAVAVIGGGILFFSNNSPRSTPPLVDLTQESKTEQVKMEKKNDTLDKDDNKMVKANSSRYIDYSKEAYDLAADKRRVLYFYASWCPTCKAANSDFTANPDKIPEDAVVIRVNYNDPDTDQEEKALAQKYGITYQHTFVQIDTSGKEIAIWNGGNTDELKKNLK